MSEIPQETQDRVSGLRAAIAVALALACVTAIAYAGAVDGEFVFDDLKIVRDNTAIRDFDIGMILGRTFGTEEVERDPTKTDPGYRPVRMLSYAVDAVFAGRDAQGVPTPYVFHVTNIIIHFLNSLLVYFLILRLLSSRFVSIAGALLFALHPIQTEAVTYISGRKDVLFTFFYLAAFLAFLRYRKGGSWVWIPVAFVTYALSLFSKEMAITLPLACLAYDVIEKISGREKISNLVSTDSAKFYLPTVIAGIAFVIFVLGVKNPAQTGASTPYLGGSFLASTGTMGRVFCHYLRLIFLPFGLCVDYSFNALPATSGPFSPWTTLPAWLIVALILAAGVFISRRKPGAAFGIFFFFITLLPVSGLVAHPEPIAERFLYLPLLGIILAVLGMMKKILDGQEAKVIFGAGAGLVLLLFLGLTSYRNDDWKTPLALYKSAVETYPDCARMQLGLAGELQKRSDPGGAHRHFSEAVRVLESAKRPGPRERGFLLQALNFRAVTAIALKNYGEAESDLSKLLSMRDVFGADIRTSPKYRHLHYFLGEAFYGLGNAASAEEAYADAIRLFNESGEELDRYSHSAFTRSIRLALRRGDSEAAESAWRGLVDALERPLRPDQSLDIMLKFLTRLLEAGENAWADRVRILITPLVRKARIEPRMLRLIGARLWETAEVLRKEKYRFRIAAALYEDMAALDPGDARPLYPLAVCYRQTGDLDRAEAVLRKLRELVDKGVDSVKVRNERLRKVDAELFSVEQQRRKRAELARPSLDKADSLIKAAHLSYKGGDKSEAEKLISKTFETISDFPMTPSVARIAGEAWTIRTRMALDAGDKDATGFAEKGIEAFSRALENPDLEDETASRLWAVSAELYEVLDNGENAASAWAKSVKHDPSLPRLRHRLALSYLRLGEGAATGGNANQFNIFAFETLGNAAHAFPNYMPVQYSLAQVSLGLSRYDVTIRAATAFLAGSDEEELFAPALIMLAKAYIGIPDLDRAAEALENAEAVASTDGQKAEIKKLLDFIERVKKKE